MGSSGGYSCQGGWGCMGSGSGSGFGACYGVPAGCFGGAASVAPIAGHAQATTAAPATIVVTLPENARLSIDGEPTRSTSTRRVFVSPSLEQGKEYTYTLQAEINQDGKPVTITRDVTVQAGKEVNVKLEANVAGVASR